MDTYLAPEPLDDDDPYGPESPLATMAGLCERLGVPLPPLPAAFIPLLEEIDETVFASRDDLDTLMNEDALIEEAAEGEAPPFVAFSHEGYGSNNWYLRYYVSLPGVSLFVIIPLGGIYMDEDTSVTLVREAFERAATLVERALAYTGASRFVVVHRGLAGGEWREASGDWQEAADPIGAVSDLLAG